MKKLLLASAVLLSLSASADASGMLFRTSDGATHAIGSTGLSIAFVDGKMIASNEKETLSLDLDNLASMEFGTATAANAVAAEVSGAVSAFDASGISLGSFKSLKDATESLPSGLYIIKSESGATTKINIKK